MQLARYRYNPAAMARFRYEKFISKSKSDEFDKQYHPRHSHPSFGNLPLRQSQGPIVWQLVLFAKGK